MKSWEFFWIRRCSLYSNSVCVCLCSVWPERLRVICRRCTDFYPKCWDAVQCIRETLVLIYQHVVRIDNPSAPRTVEIRERDWEAKRERKRREWWWEKERMSLHADTPRRAVMFYFYFFIPLTVNSRPRSSYKARLSFSTSSKDIRSFIFNVFCSKQVVIVLHICVWYANS